MELASVAATARTPAQNFTGDVYPTPIYSAMLKAKPDGGDRTTWLEPVPSQR